MSNRAVRRSPARKPAPHLQPVPAAPPAPPVAGGPPSIPVVDGPLPPVPGSQPLASSYPMTEGEHQMLTTLIDREGGALKDLGQMMLEILRVWPRVMELAQGAQTAKNEQLTLARKMAADRGIPLGQPDGGQWNVNPVRKCIERVG